MREGPDSASKKKKGLPLEEYNSERDWKTLNLSKREESPLTHRRGKSISKKSHEREK